MSKFSITRAPRFAAGFVLVAALAAAPMSAQAADTNASGTLGAGELANTAPSIAPFTTTLSGINQTKTTDVGAWTITDATGSNAGYSITVTASDPTVDGVASEAGTGGSLSLVTPATATAADGNPADTAPVAAAGPLMLDAVNAATVQNAPAGTGQGKWDVAEDAGGLSVSIPGDASAGAYSSTLTFTTAAPVAP